jgi:hypothetical protein
MNKERRDQGLTKLKALPPPVMQTLPSPGAHAVAFVGGALSDPHDSPTVTATDDRDLGGGSAAGHTFITDPVAGLVSYPVPSTPTPGSGTPASNPGSSNKRAKMMSPDEVRSPTVTVRACCDMSPLSRVLHSLYCALLFVQVRYEQHERHHSEQMDLLRIAVTPPSHTTASAAKAPPASEAPLCTVRTRLKKWTKADVRAWFTAAAGR